MKVKADVIGGRRPLAHNQRVVQWQCGGHSPRHGRAGPLTPTSERGYNMRVKTLSRSLAIAYQHRCRPPGVTDIRQLSKRVGRPTIARPELSAGRAAATMRSLAGGAAGTGERRGHRVEPAGATRTLSAAPSLSPSSRRASWRSSQVAVHAAVNGVTASTDLPSARPAPAGASRRRRHRGGAHALEEPPVNQSPSLDADFAASRSATGCRSRPRLRVRPARAAARRPGGARQRFFGQAHLPVFYAAPGAGSPGSLGAALQRAQRAGPAAGWEA